MRSVDRGKWLHIIVQVATRIGHVMFYLVMTVVFTVSVAMALASAKDAADQQPVVWGTFYAESCKPAARGSCTPIGRWISDDGTVVKVGIQLDGSPGHDGTARASFQPYGLINDEDRNIVHTETWTGAGLWMPWVLAAFCVGTTVHYASRWRTGRGPGRRYA